MIFVWKGSWKPQVTAEQSEEVLARRAQWQYPSGIRVLGEYWLTDNNPAVILVFEADSFAKLMEIGMPWGDVFEMTCTPATTAEEGLKIGSELMARRRAA